MALTYEAVQAACARAGYRVERQNFDCGTTLRVYDASTLIVSVTRECGDNETAPEALLDRMVSAGLVRLEHLNDA